jgi:tetratricopeptide (TPR) repeat protein
MSQTEGPLRAARVARGWSQSRAAEELAALAAARGVPVAAPLSLKTQLSRWENQHALPEEHYRDLLGELYERSEVELGLVDPVEAPSVAGSDIEELRAELAAAATLDEPAVELIRTQLRVTRQLDDRLGAAAVTGSAFAQLSYLERALAHGTDSYLRRQLGRLMVDAATLAGRLALDGAEHGTAWHHFETAKAGAREAESSALLAYAMVEQAEVLTDIGEAATAAGLIDQAITTAATEPSAPLRAWFEASRGEALAAAGAAGPAHSAYRSAERELSLGAVRGDLSFVELPFLRFDLPALHRRRGHARRLLHEDESAIEDLRQALDDGGGSSRDVAGIHIDLVHAHHSIGQLTEAAEHARAARAIATRIGSARLVAELDRPRDSVAEPASRS